MARFAEGSIAGIDLEDTNTLPLRVDVLDGEQLKGNAAATNVTALDLTVHSQVLDTSAKAGIHFGVKLYQIPISVLDAILAAMETAILAGNTFEVLLADDDGVDSISVDAVIDYQALNGKPYTRGNFAGVYVRDVTLRFISTGAA